MPQLTLNRALVVSGTRYEAGDVVDYSGNDLGYIVAAGFASVDDTPATATTTATTTKATRTKAQIAADLAAAKAAEAQLQADLSQATD